MDNTTHAVRLANWKATIEQCQARPKGQTAKQWLAENGISDKQYYYWLRKVREQAFSEMKPLLPAVGQEQPPAVTLAEIPRKSIFPPETVPAVTIKTKKSTIEISSAVPDRLVIQLIKAVAHAL